MTTQQLLHLIGKVNSEPQMEIDHYRFMQDSIAFLNPDGGYTVYPTGRVGDIPELYCDGSSEQAAKEEAWRRYTSRIQRIRRYLELRNSK